MSSRLAAPGRSFKVIRIGSRAGGKTLWALNEHLGRVGNAGLSGFVDVERWGHAGAKSVAWQEMRRTVARELLDDGVEISTVAKALGHASVQTMARYDRRGSRAVAKALQSRHIPYRRRT